jgi:hypothetical protein
MLDVFLVDAFVESRYMMFIKYAAVQLQQLSLKRQQQQQLSTPAVAPPPPPPAEVGFFVAH